VHESIPRHILMTSTTQRQASSSIARATCRGTTTTLNQIPASTPTVGSAQRQCSTVASYTLNEQAVAHAKHLIAARQYVRDSDWGEVQPDAETENKYLESHSWVDYGAWHLGLSDGASDGTKARYAFVYGDLRRLHRSALIACVYRAAEWRHKTIELAAHDLLQLFDASVGG
jgi:hypothetical protein